FSERSIVALNEQVFADLGFSVAIKQTTSPGTNPKGNNGFLSGSISYIDPSQKWLTGVFDRDDESSINWIRSGVQDFDVSSATPPIISEYNDYTISGEHIDPEQKFENILAGTWAPYRLVN